MGIVDVTTSPAVCYDELNRTVFEDRHHDKQHATQQSLRILNLVYFVIYRKLPVFLGLDCLLSKLNDCFHLRLHYSEAIGSRLTNLV